MSDERSAEKADWGKALAAVLGAGVAGVGGYKLAKHAARNLIGDINQVEELNILLKRNDAVRAAREALGREPTKAEAVRINNQVNAAFDRLHRNQKWGDRLALGTMFGIPAAAVGQYVGREIYGGMQDNAKYKAPLTSG